MLVFINMDRMHLGLCSCEIGQECLPCFFICIYWEMWCQQFSAMQAMVLAVF